MFIITTITQGIETKHSYQHKGKSGLSRHRINNTSQTLNMGPIILNVRICKVIKYSS
jgi:hypothetical protein